MATYTEAVQKIERLMKLPVGWDYGRDGPASVASFRGALIAMFILDKFGTKEFDIAPGVNGTIILLGYRGEELIEIQARTDGRFDFVYEGDGDEAPVVGATLAELAAKLEECGWQSPRFFVSCTRRGIFRGSGDILPSHSAVPLMVAAYLSSAQIALPKAETKYARSYESFTMKKSLESRRSSGEYREALSQRAYA